MQVDKIYQQAIEQAFSGINPLEIKRILFIRCITLGQSSQLIHALGQHFEHAAITFISSHDVWVDHPAIQAKIIYQASKRFDRQLTPAQWYQTVSSHGPFDLVVIPYPDNSWFAYANVRAFAAPFESARYLEIGGDGRFELSGRERFLARQQENNVFPVEVSSLPGYYTVNIIEQCNLRCVMCDIDDGPGYDTLPYEQFESLGERLFANARTLTLNGYVGEPLLHPRFNEIIALIDRKWPQLGVTLATNATSLKGKKLKAIVESQCIKDIRLSIHAVKKETYESIMLRADYARTMENIREFMRSQGRGAAEKHMAVGFSFVLMRNNFDELPDFVRWAAELGADYILVWDCQISQEGNEDLSVFDTEAQVLHIYAQAREIASQYGVNLILPTPYKSEEEKGTPCEEQEQEFLCTLPWSHAYISPNGDVMPCCYYAKVMGNVFNTSFESIWNGAGYRQFREQINSGRWPGPCQSCPQNSRDYRTSPQKVVHKRSVIHFRPSERASLVNQ